MKSEIILGVIVSIFALVILAFSTIFLKRKESQNNTKTHSKYDQKSMKTSGMKLFDLVSEYVLVFIYLLVVLGSWFVMFAHGYPLITKSSTVSNIHKVSRDKIISTKIFEYNPPLGCESNVRGRHVSV